MKHTAYWADVRHTITTNKKRFIAIVVIVALGLMVFTLLDTISGSIRRSSDDYFTGQNLRDLSVTSSSGLSHRDVEAIARTRGIAKAQGIHTESAYTKVRTTSKSATVTALRGADSIDTPEIVHGRLPNKVGEVSVDRQYLKDSGKSIGSTLTFNGQAHETMRQQLKQQERAKQSAATQAPQQTGTQQLEAQQSMQAKQAEAQRKLDSLEQFKTGSYTIVGETRDATDMMGGALSMFAGGGSGYTFFTAAQSVEGDATFSSIYATCSGGHAKGSFSSEYNNYAQQEIKRIERLNTGKVKWSISDRSATSGYANIKNQTQMIDKIGLAFPILFLVIAVLISVTTIVRMTEEDRPTIGIYKALGYSDSAIMAKYIVYTLAACIIGGIIGAVLGLVVMPMAAWYKMLDTLIILPTFTLKPNWARTLGGLALFVVAIAGCALIATGAELTETAAQIMRPKAPQPGKKVLLEHVGPLWGRMSFLSKVTARNVFRYKSRALMAIIGVLGCTALMMLGLGMRSSLNGLMPLQFSQVERYDAMAVVNPIEDGRAKQHLDSNDDIKSKQEVHVENVKVSRASSGGSDSNASESQDVQMIVVPSGAHVSRYLGILDADNGNVARDLPQDGMALSVNAAKLLGLSPGSKAGLETGDMTHKDAKVSFIAQNYTGNYVFIGQHAYEQLFGRYTGNAFLVNTRHGVDQDKFINHLKDDSAFLSVTGSQQTRDSFNDTFKIVNVVVSMFVVLGAALVIVVLFTLGTINIAERKRELASIKVLGFRDREVHGYVNKEMLALTVIGVALGLPAGWGLTHGVINMLDIAGAHIVAALSPWDFVICGALSLVFELVVTLFTNRMLDHIDMVESLQSPE